VKRTCLLFLPLVALLADPKPPDPKPCSPSLSNSTCFIQIDTALPVSPLPIQLNSGAAVTLIVKKRGVEKILVETEWKEIDTPDPALEIVKSFLPSLAKLRLESFTKMMLDRPSEFPSVERVKLQQNETDDILMGLRDSLDAANTKLKELAEITVAKCENTAFSSAQTDALNHIAAATAGSTSLRAMDESIKRATAELTKLMDAETVDEKKISRFRTAIEQIDAKRARQAAVLKTINDAQDALRAIEKVLTEKPPAGKPVPPCEFRTDDPITPPTGNWLGTTATIKLTAVDAVAGTKKTLSTITLSWNTTRWEISAGAIFSSLPDRSFSTTRNVVNGAAQPDANKFVTAQTINRPTVVPVALAHYRLSEKLTATHRRLAFLLTGGIGVNTTSGTADFIGGVSIGYRSLLFTPAVHFGRDSKLTNGVRIGSSFADSVTPPTQRVWTPAFAIGITYRIPFK
jgi:hypothetical protein